MPQTEESVNSSAPQMSSSQSDPVDLTPKKKSNFLRNLMIFFFVVIILGLLGVGAYFLYDMQQEESSDSNTATGEEQENEEPQDEDINNEDVVVNYTTYQGDYVSASLPDGWTLTEYEDGDGGLGTLVDGTYDGITAILITDNLGQEVYSIEAVNGIGSIGLCQFVPTFDDTSASYIQSKIDLYQEMYPGQEPTQTEVGDDYSELTLLGKRGRLSGIDFYWDATETTASFDPHCGMPANMPENGGLSFIYTSPGTDPTIMFDYIYTPKPGMSSTDTEALAAVLDSIEVL